MYGHYFSRLLALLLLLPASTVIAQNSDCDAKSQSHRVALLELYTSEGCSSCPPADKWLSKLDAKGIDATKLVPLSLHVDYWNYIGWRDPYSSSQYTARQRKVAGHNRLRTIYTPQMVLDGRDYRSWRRQEISNHLKRTNSKPAGADLNLEWSEQGSGENQSVSIKLKASLNPPHAVSQPVVNLVIYENNLVSHVDAGENDGRSLKHDYVVRRLLKYPFNVGREHIERQVSIPLNKDWNKEQLGLALFVQDDQNGKVMQAMAHAIDCK